MLARRRSSSRGRLRSRWGERGASAVEFALIAPVMILLVVGIVEFGRLYYLQTSLTNAAREGARAAALSTATSNPDFNTAARTAAKNAFSPSPDPSDNQIEVAIAVAGSSFYNTGQAQTCSAYSQSPSVRITISYPTDMITSYFGPNFTLKGQAVMRCGG